MFPVKHVDVLEQVIHYKVPPDKFDELALNLAHDIVTGKRDVEDARRFYANTAMAAMKGEKPAYTQKLQFSPSSKAGDPDKPFKQ